MKIAALIFLCMSSMAYAAACRELPEGSDRWFDLIFSQSIDHCPSGIIHAPAAEGFILMAADKNPKQLFVLKDRYKLLHIKLHKTWQNVVDILIENGQFDCAKALLQEDVSWLSKRSAQLLREKDEKKWLAVVRPKTPDA